MDSQSAEEISDNPGFEGLDFNSIMSVCDKTCAETEQVAVDSLCAMPVPLLYPFKRLSKQDCSFLLRKYEGHFNVVEKAVFLTTFTDYVSCALGNAEYYDTFRKKSDVKCIAFLLKRLGNHWCRFFTHLRKDELSIAQITSLLVLLRQSVDRVDTTEKVFLTKALTAGEQTLNNFIRIMSANEEKNKITKENNLKGKEKKTKPNSGSEVQKDPCRKVNSGEVKENVNTKNKILEAVENVKPKNTKPSCKSSSKSISTESVSVHKNEGPKQPEKPDQVKKRKATSTLERYILKPCENKISSPESKPVLEVIEMKDDGSESPLKESNPDQQDLAKEDLKQSSEKKPESDERYLVNGRVNAFKLMMEGKSLKTEEKPKVTEQKPIIVDAFKLLMGAKRRKLSEPSGRSPLGKAKVPMLKCK